MTSSTQNGRSAAKAVDMIFRAEHGVKTHGGYSANAAIIAYAEELREDGWTWHPETAEKVRLSRTSKWK